MRPELKAFKKAIDDHYSAQAATVLNQQTSNAQTLLAWLSYIESSELTNVANELIEALRVLLLETFALLALGLTRAALPLMRTQIDVLFGWLYYKDHRVEWNYLNEHGDRWILKATVEEYLETYDRRFKDRIALLSKTWAVVEPYSVLSAHVHMQGAATIPKVKSLSDLVACDELEQAMSLQKAVCEYLTDILCAYFAADWARLPGLAKTAVSARLSEPELSAFHSIDNPARAAQRRRGISGRKSSPKDRKNK